MKKSIQYLTITIAISTFLFSCNNTKTNKSQTVKKSEKTLSQADIKNSEGYKLMESKCFICHLEKPDPSKKDKMIAPPMLRVKEHYLPNYQNKEDFVNAVVAFTKNPSKDKTLMPGTVKKFNLMPKLNYDENELKLIAETIYDYNFGDAPKMRMQMSGNLKLNNGKRWKLKKESIEKVDSLTNKLYSFKSDNIEDYNKFGKELFNDAKEIMLDKSYTGEKFNQIHNFFNSAEEDMHSLIAEKSVDNAKKTLDDLKEKFNNFYNFFEAE